MVESKACQSRSKGTFGGIRNSLKWDLRDQRNASEPCHGPQPACRTNFLHAAARRQFHEVSALRATVFPDPWFRMWPGAQVPGRWAVRAPQVTHDRCFCCYKSWVTSVAEVWCPAQVRVVDHFVGHRRLHPFWEQTTHNVFLNAECICIMPEEQTHTWTLST